MQPEDEKRSPLRRVFAANLAGDVEYLLRALVDPVVRRQAARFLGDLGDARAVMPLVRLLGVEDPVTRRAAAIALGKLGALSAYPALLEVAQRDGDLAARSWALASLANLDPVRAVPVLIEALDDSAWMIRRGAAYSLGKTHNRAALAPLRAASHNERWFRRGVYRKARRTILTGHS